MPVCNIRFTLPKLQIYNNWTCLQIFVHFFFRSLKCLQKNKVLHFFRSNTNGTTKVLDGGAAAEVGG